MREWSDLPYAVAVHIFVFWLHNTNPVVLYTVTMSDSEDLLAILNAHGQQFLSCFDSTEGQQPKAKKRKLSQSEDVPKPSIESRSEGSSEQDDDSEDEWGGVSSASGSSSEQDMQEYDDDFTADSKSRAAVVVFSDPSSSKGKQKEEQAGALKKQFMVCPQFPK